MHRWMTTFLRSGWAVSQRQSINQTARRLESQRRLKRYVGPGGKIVNALPDGPSSNESEAPPAMQRGDGSRTTEDEVKFAVRDHPTGQGYDVAVAWGRTRGIDIDARHPEGRRIIIEAKAEVGTSGPQQVNYFLGMLGARSTDGRRSSRLRHRVPEESAVPRTR